MPNWACGNIRIRGSLKDIVRVLENEVLVEGLYRNVKTYERKSYEVKPEMEVDEENNYILLKSPCSGNDMLEDVKYLEEYFYVNGSKRNFIEGVGSGDTVVFDLLRGSRGDDDWVALNEDFKAAWSVQGDIYSQIAVKYGVDIKIMVWERGMEFEQVIIAYRDGRHEEFLPDVSGDWAWKAVHPMYGG